MPWNMSNDLKVKELVQLMGEENELRLVEVSDTFNLSFKSEAATNECIEITDLNYGMPISDLVKLIG